MTVCDCVCVQRCIHVYISRCTHQRNPDCTLRHMFSVLVCSCCWYFPLVVAVGIFRWFLLLVSPVGIPY